MIIFAFPPCLGLFLGLLSSEDVSASGEALLYCVGALKFLSGNGAILRLLLDNNCFGAAQTLIRRLCEVDDANLTMAGHILVQVCDSITRVGTLLDNNQFFVQEHNVLL